ncbi:MAG TPA: exopolysaccharide biosynthesis polyprenyl glycosylphosphotransferase [Solirubrobacteraceae bacterium]
MQETARDNEDAVDSSAAVARPGAARGRFSIRARSGPWRDVLRRRLLALADAVAVLTGGFLAAELVDAPPVYVSAALLPLWLVLAKLNGLYDADHRALRHLTVDELGAIGAWVATATTTEVLLLTSIGEAHFSAAGAVGLFALVFLCAGPLRAVARTVWRRRVPRERALIIGSGPVADASRRKLELFSDIHVDCAAQLDERALNGGSWEHELLGDGTFDRVIIASEGVSESLIAHQVAVCRLHGLKLSVVPPARAMFGTAVQLHHIAELPMIEYSTWDPARSTALIKRTVDTSLAAVALVVLAPVILLIALLVRLDSRGPAFFVQRRAGLNGAPFPMVKFRTMTADAEARLAELVDIHALEVPMFKLAPDPRVTRVGRLLRRTSLDELPQLINVVRGEMSFIGPRPEQVELVERYAPEHRFRLSVKPGITGPMQVYGRGDLRFDERLAVEREYVENLSLARDLRILLLSIAAVARGRGAL